VEGMVQAIVAVSKPACTADEIVQVRVSLLQALPYGMAPTLGGLEASIPEM
jgi:hypothetical protein